MIRIPRLQAASVLALALLLLFTLPIAAEEISGRVSSLDLYSRTFTMTDDDGEDHAFRLADDHHVVINGEKSSLADLQAGDAVTVVYEFMDKDPVATVVRCTRE